MDFVAVLVLQVLCRHDVGEWSFQFFIRNAKGTLAAHSWPEDVGITSHAAAVLQVVILEPRLSYHRWVSPSSKEDEAGGRFVRFNEGSLERAGVSQEVDEPVKVIRLGQHMREEVRVRLKPPVVRALLICIELKLLDDESDLKIV